MRKRDQATDLNLDEVVERIAAERKAIRARLAAPPRRKGDARTKTRERSKLRELFRQYEGLLDR
jgi:hypothetical protein